MMGAWNKALRSDACIVAASSIAADLPVAAIVPAFNEAHGIEKILSILQQVDCLDQIIVVDDGSDDNTLEIACRAVRKDPRIRVIHNETNQGKGNALFTGWRATRAACLLMIDADLLHLTPGHVLDLINPVRTHQAQMTFGLFRGGGYFTDLSHILTPWLTGQRCLRRELLEDLPEEAAQGYGFETALTLAARRHQWVIQSVRMHGVSHVVKERHWGLVKGLKNRAIMWRHIYNAWRLSR